MSALFTKQPSQVKLSTLAALCTALDCTPGDLLALPGHRLAHPDTPPRAASARASPTAAPQPAAVALPSVAAVPPPPATAPQSSAVGSPSVAAVPPLPAPAPSPSAATRKAGPVHRSLPPL
ncbi:helix-turn-helix domain-containing protein [Streptomyces sp. NPDC058294]|uniref:helix-turn-helix domain-containing protein n=1 Tax=Streptomyces sp. NPDC058294 TaxID=3346430 RepID=UPI0036E16EF1